MDFSRDHRRTWLRRVCATFLAAFLAAGGLSACRFGNSITPAEAENSNDPSGYYRTGVSDLTFCADTGTTLCKPAGVSLLPTLASSIYTNPLIVLLEDQSTGEGFVAAANDSGYAFPIFFESDNVTLSYSGSTNAETLWSDANCTTRMYLEQSGRLLTDSAFRGKEFGGKPLSGEVEMNVFVVQTIEGSACATELGAMKACYLDASACGGVTESFNQQLQLAAQDFLKQHVLSGAVDLNDPAFTSLRAISYEVNYR